MDLAHAHLVAPLMAVLIVKIVYVIRNAPNKKIKLRNLIDRETDMSFLVAAVSSYTFASFFTVDQVAPWVLNGIVLLYLVWLNQSGFKLSNWWAIAVGLLAALLASITHLEQEWRWLNARPSNQESQWYLYAGIALFVLAQIAVYKLRHKQWRKLPTSKKLVRTINTTLALPAALIIFFAFIQTETRNQVFDDRIYIWVMALYIVLANIWAVKLVYRKSKKHLREERDHFLKLKETDKKRKRKSKKTKKTKKS